MASSAGLAGADPERDPAGFIRAATALDTAPLCPEIRLHLATEITPIWQACEAFLERAGIAPPYWAFAWPGSVALARFLLDDPARVEGRRVMDVASGAGLAAIAAAKAGAASVLAMDIDPLAGAAIALNAEENGIVLDIRTGDVTAVTPEADLILCGDICYEASSLHGLWPWLQRAAGAAEVILADPGRAYRPLEGLVEITRMIVPTLRDLESRDERETVLFRVAGIGSDAPDAARGVC